MEIQILKKQGFSLRHIAREVGCAVNTIRRQLAQDAAPKYDRKVKRPTNTVLDGVRSLRQMSMT